MTMFHLIAASGDSADDLLSLGVYESAVPRADLEKCLAERATHPVVDRAAVLNDPAVAQLLHREQEQLRAALAEPEVSFIVTPADTETHFVPDHDGVVKDAGEVERKRARMRRDFGVDLV